MNELVGSLGSLEGSYNFFSRSPIPFKLEPRRVGWSLTASPNFASYHQVSTPVATELSPEVSIPSHSLDSHRSRIIQLSLGLRYSLSSNSQSRYAIPKYYHVLPKGGAIFARRSPYLAHDWHLLRDQKTNDASSHLVRCEIIAGQDSRVSQLTSAK